MLYSLADGVYRRSLPRKVISSTINFLAISGFVLFTAILIDGFFFGGRGLISVLIWILER